VVEEDPHSQKVAAMLHLFQGLPVKQHPHFPSLRLLDLHQALQGINLLTGSGSIRIAASRNQIHPVDHYSIGLTERMLGFGIMDV
jgi:hypothetical protein